MAIVDRRLSVSGDTAVKAPCKAATTANITLSGEQTIDGVAIVAADRVLVKNQTTASENGIYDANTGVWTRTRDFDGAHDIVSGTRVLINSGSTNGTYEFYISSSDPLTIDSSDIVFTQIVQVSVNSGDVQNVTATYELVAGFATYTLTSITNPPSSLIDRAQFRFVPGTTAYAGGVKIIHADAGGGTKFLLATDTYSLSTYGDIQKNKPVTIEWRDTLDAFVIVDGLQFSQSIFSHGTAKLQTSGASTISLTQEDGRGLMVWNPTTGSFRPVSFAVITNAAIFSNVNYVEGVGNQALAANQLYSVYVYDINGGLGNDMVLDFWRTYTGVGSIGYIQIVNEIGIYVKSNLGGSGVDNTRTFLGLLWTGSSNVATALTGTALSIPCQSQHKVWRFPAQTSSIAVSGFTNTSYAVQSGLSIDIVTTGITDTGAFRLHSSVTNDTAASINYIQLDITGTQFDGQAFAASSTEALASTPANNDYVFLTSEYGVALPAGHYTIKPSLKVSGGTASFNISMNTYVAI